jgi:hypothetical protein
MEQARALHLPHWPLPRHLDGDAFDNMADPTLSGLRDDVRASCGERARHLAAAIVIDGKKARHRPDLRERLLQVKPAQSPGFIALFSKKTLARTLVRALINPSRKTQEKQPIIKQHYGKSTLEVTDRSRHR